MSEPVIKKLPRNKCIDWASILPNIAFNTYSNTIFYKEEKSIALNRLGSSAATSGYQVQYVLVGVGIGLVGLIMVQRALFEAEAMV